MIQKISLLLTCLIFAGTFCVAQVTIDNYSVNGLGQVQLSIQAQANKYYVLHAQHSPTFNWETSMTMGVNGTMVISEPGAAYPLANYTITEHDIAAPDDSDGDGIDDITEFNNMPTDAPLNFAEPIAFVDGATSIPDAQTFLDLAAVNNVSWAPFLDGQLYVKFGILNRDTDNPQIYFINSNTYTIHASFWSGIGATVSGDDGSGEIVFNANQIHPNGVIGSYSWNFSFGNAYSFEESQRTYELLLANMPFLQGNLNHFIGQADENTHTNSYAADFVGSRVDVVLESDVFAEINYIPFHEAEGYGFFKHMTDLNETPGSRDIVLYDALPNSLPRVGGIITSVIQTPLSHVNLRAIQDNVPNAYIEDPLSIDSIANLLDGYIYYKVENETFQIREATLTEVNDWYEELRPTEPQIPIRDLSRTEILALDDVEFDMSSSFGAKCTNVATMRSFGFPDGTIPDGFGIPFYYYDEFMKYNNFYEEAQVMIDNPTFQVDLNFRTERLKDFRRSIKDAPMPQWMLDDLQAMHDDFPVGTNVRCRSSTNNEDLPGFSGAGLYTSKTQYPEEGHIKKSIQQVYASMWNFRAYEERDFYRVDHFIAAMGVLCHPNFQEEQSNGVGISIDPIYETENTFYLNTQVGESLITNPDPNSVPEEILLYENPSQAGGYLVLRLSNLVNPGELVMDQVYLDQMRDYLAIIHDEFSILYDVVGAEGFGMDIEYKVTAENQLIIKQARPWVSFWANIKANSDLAVEAIVAPQSSTILGSSELVTATIANTGLTDMDNFDLTLLVDGQLMETMNISSIIEPFSEADFQFTIPQDFSTIGDYNVAVIVSDLEDEYDNNDTLNVVLTKIIGLDGAIAIGNLSVNCDDELEVNTIITNHGGTTITDVQIEVEVNGLVVDIISTTVDIPFQGQGTVLLNITDNLLLTDNNITLKLLQVNNQVDGDGANNSTSTSTDLESNSDTFTLILTADQYPTETTWEIIDGESNQVVVNGDLPVGQFQVYSEDFCLNLTSCYTLAVYDSYGDGICCGFGQGNIELLNASGQTILENIGDFDSSVELAFCPDGGGCDFTASFNLNNPSSISVSDGAISINTTSGLTSLQYSIDGGQTFSANNSFTGLAQGDYDVFIQDASGVCSYQETVTLAACTFVSADIIASKVASTVSANGSIEINPTSGLAPYQYSIDGGQSFVSTNVFTDLAIGTYNVIVKDASEICLYEKAVSVRIFDIILNELLASNDELNADATGLLYNDWIELYNPGSGAVNLAGHFLSDDPLDPFKWDFPAGVSIPAGGYLIVWADNSDSSPLHTNFKLSSAGETVSLSAPDGTLLDQMTYGDVNTNVSIGRYPNGTGDWTELPPTFEAENTLLIPQGNGDLLINEFMASNSTTVQDPGGMFEDWVELYNNSNQAINLEGYTLSDTESNLALWSFPAGTTIAANDYLIVWLDAPTIPETGLHANFKLSSLGELIALSDPSGTLLDIEYYGKTQADQSISRITNGLGGFIPSPTTFSQANSTVSESVATGQLRINELMASNSNTASDQDGEFDDWVELFNNSANSISLGTYFLSDDSDNLEKWSFPASASIAPGEYKIVWIDGDSLQVGLHTNFKLSGVYDRLLLSDASSQIIDEVSFANQIQDISIARIPNWSGEFVASQATFAVINAFSDVDSDGDGFTATVDCDDTDASINPAALEILGNEIDENCDGTIVLRDADNDGFYSDVDCNDFNFFAWPGAPEIPDNGIDEDCNGEDLIQSIPVSIKFLLEGPYIGNGLMGTDLLNLGLLDLCQPYSGAPYHHSESICLNNSADFPAQTVDWVLIELRAGTPQLTGLPGTSLIERKAAILLSDGSVVDVAGNDLRFGNMVAGVDYYLLVRHRNHLDVLSATSLQLASTLSFDFTAASTSALGIGQLKPSGDGHYYLYAGDYNQDGVVQTTDYDEWKNAPAILSDYQLTDGNLDGSVQVTDYDVWELNKAKNGIAEIKF